MNVEVRSKVFCLLACLFVCFEVMKNFSLRRERELRVVIQHWAGGVD